MLPSPYYDHGGITIYHGDCREILPLLGRFDLALTDPPYGHGSKWQGGSWATDKVYAGVREWDSAPIEQRWLEYCAGKADQKCIWGGNYYIMPPSRCWLIWLKPDTAPTFADFEMAWTDLNRPCKRWLGPRNPGGNNSRLHPTEKPVTLMSWCLSFFPEAKTVIDPYMGSGPVAKACKDRGLRYVGIDLVEKYCEIAAKRLAQETLF